MSTQQTSSAGTGDLLVCHLGRVPYEEGVEIQERLRSRVQEGGREVLLLLEHDPVYTLGRRSEPGDLGLGEAGVGTRARSHEGREWTGVWVEDRKLASIGIHVSRGVSAHGFAVNVSNDLAPFGWVVACGLPSVAMTSLAQEGSPEGLACFRKRVAYRFAQAFGRRQRLISPERLGIGREPAAGAGAPTALGT